MSFHEDESFSLKDPSTVEQELSKPSEIECTVKNDSGVNDQSDISSHDDNMIAYEAKESCSPSIEISSSDTTASQIENKAESSESEHEPESAIQVEEGLVEIGNRLNFLVIHYCIR